MKNQINNRHVHVQIQFSLIKFEFKNQNSDHKCKLSKRYRLTNYQYMRTYVAYDNSKYHLRRLLFSPHVEDNNRNQLP